MYSKYTRPLTELTQQLSSQNLILAMKEVPLVNRIHMTNIGVYIYRYVL